MESVLIRFEQANSRKVTGTIATLRTALILPLMGMSIVKPELGTLPAVTVEQVTPAVDSIASTQHHPLS